MALVLEDPTAGAAFWPSVLPTCSRLAGPREIELVVEMIDSVGLPGRAGCGLGAAEREVVEELAMGDDMLLR